MTIAVDTSTPLNADQPTGTVATVTSPSFTPPANSLVLALWSGNAPTVTTTNATATITDSLASHLTYTLVQKANPTTTSSTTTGGDAYIWWAKVTTSAAMTVSVTTGATSSMGSALQVVVLTGTDLTTPVATSGVAAANTAPTAITQNYTPTRSAGMGFLVFTDWNDSTSAPPAAGTGCTRISGVSAANITYGTYRRTSPDDVAGTANTVQTATWTGPDPVLWAWVDIQPPAAAAGNPARPRVVNRSALIRAANF